MRLVQLVVIEAIGSAILLNRQATLEIGHILQLKQPYLVLNRKACLQTRDTGVQTCCLQAKLSICLLQVQELLCAELSQSIHIKLLSLLVGLVPHVLL